MLLNFHFYYNGSSLCLCLHSFLPVFPLSFSFYIILHSISKLYLLKPTFRSGTHVGLFHWLCWLRDIKQINYYFICVISIVTLLQTLRTKSSFKTVHIIKWHHKMGVCFKIDEVYIVYTIQKGVKIKVKSPI